MSEGTESPSTVMHPQCITPLTALYPTLEARFWRDVQKSEDCWIWTGARSHNYGSIAKGPMRAGTLRAHRVSWELHYGPIPKGLYICHHCDVPLCVRPDHLFVGTQRTNIDDMDRKGRRRPAHGEQVGSARMTVADVRTIRERCGRGVLRSVLAREYKVDWRTIARIADHRTWQHV